MYFHDQKQQTENLFYQLYDRCFVKFLLAINLKHPIILHGIFLQFTFRVIFPQEMYLSILK